MTMKDYRTIVVGTDGSSLAGPTVGARPPGSPSTTTPIW